MSCFHILLWVFKSKPCKAEFKRYTQVLERQTNLAFAELYNMTAGIFRICGLYDGTEKQKGSALELYESTREDLDMVTDFAVPFIKSGREEFRVI